MVVATLCDHDTESRIVTGKQWWWWWLLVKAMVTLEKTATEQTTDGCI